MTRIIYIISMRRMVLMFNLIQKSQSSRVRNKFGRQPVTKGVQQPVVFEFSASGSMFFHFLCLTENTLMSNCWGVMLPLVTQIRTTNIDWLNHFISRHQYKDLRPHLISKYHCRILSLYQAYQRENQKIIEKKTRIHYFQ